MAHTCIHLTLTPFYAYHTKIFLRSVNEVNNEICFACLNVHKSNYIKSHSNVNHISTKVNVSLYVTSFVKRGLIHAFDFANLMSHNFVYD